MPTLPVNRSAGKWILPQPKKESADEFVPIPKIGNLTRVPFGYKLNEKDPLQLDPIPLELEALEKAKGYIHRYSSRHVAAWLTKVTGRYITHRGLLQRIRSESKNKSKASSLWSWAARYKKAVLLAEKYQKRKGSRGFEKAKKIIEAEERIAVAASRHQRNNDRGSDSGGERVPEESDSADRRDTECNLQA
jgi:hypothetical protein